MLLIYGFFFFAGEIDKVKRTTGTSMWVFIFLNINDTKHLVVVSSHINRNGINFLSFCFDFVQFVISAEIKFINSFVLGFCPSYLPNYSVLKSDWL